MAEHETITDIIKKIRAEADFIEESARGSLKVGEDLNGMPFTESDLESALDLAETKRKEADRLDAAHRREVDALHQQIADLRQQRDLWSKRAAELVEKCNEQHAKLKQVGNAAKLREALEKVRDSFYVNDYGDYQMEYGDKVSDLVDAAVAAPARNCDVGTAEEQSQRFDTFCDAHKYVGDDGANWCSRTCPCYNDINCGVNWAQMPYEEGGAK